MGDGSAAGNDEADVEADDWDVEADAEHRRGANVGDDATTTVRLLRRQCSTCVFFPDDRMHLGEERRLSFIAQAAEADSYVVCHQTIRRADEVQPAICRGFWNRYRQVTRDLQLIDRLGMAVEVEPPATPY